MLDILKNFDSAGNGSSKSSSTADKNNMKAILESFHKVNESEAQVDECGEGMAMQAPQMAQNQGNPVTMNVSLNASGKDNVDELMALLKSAGLDNAKQVDTDDMNQDQDMAAMRAAMLSMSEPEAEPEDDEVEEWDNSPEGVEGDPMNLELPMDGNDLNRKKDRKAIRTNDPALESTIKERLWAALSEKKVAEGRGRGKKKKMEDVKTTEGRGRGRGKSKKMKEVELQTAEGRGRGRGKKKK